MRFPSAHRTLAVAIAASIAIVPACDEPTAPLPRGGPPTALELTIVGGFAAESRVVELRGDTIVLRRSWSGVGIDSARRVPTAEDWREFWEAARAAGIPLWRAEYVAEHIMDGMAWGLTLDVGGRRIRSSGANAYPDGRGREHEGEMTPEFRAFLAAIGRLAGMPVSP